MNEAIKLILSLSLSGSIIAVIIFAIKPFIKHRLSKTLQYYIWIVVLLRLVMPFSFEGSIMNSVFYSDKPSIDISSQVTGKSDNLISSSKLPSVQENVTNAAYNVEADKGNHFKDLFNQYVVYFWLFGIIIAITVNLVGYIRFLKYLKETNKPATEEQNKILLALLKGSYKVKLVRNQFVTTPMLIGILRPYIVIPDMDFDEIQLENILLHETSHLKRFDIGVKWFTMIATSIHWFNPLMYFIRKEINHACELACDEAVIKNLNAEEKQAYGDTLIYVVSEHKFTAGVLQATMCEEKKSLKERLIAIMKHSKKSRLTKVLSVLLMISVITSAIVLGASVGNAKDNPSKININAEDMTTYNLNKILKYKTPYLGDNSKVSAIVSHLPVPDSYFKQQYISMITDHKPYKLNVFYEREKDTLHSGEWPVTNTDNVIYSNMQKNALVLFCMIGNVDEVTFAFRNSESQGKLDASKYDTTFTFSRASLQEKYGNLSVMDKDLSLLQNALIGK